MVTPFGIKKNQQNLITDIGAITYTQKKNGRIESLLLFRSWLKTEDVISALNNKFLIKNLITKP